MDNNNEQESIQESIKSLMRTALRLQSSADEGKAILVEILSTNPKSLYDDRSLEIFCENLPVELAVFIRSVMFVGFYEVVKSVLEKQYGLVI